MPSRPSFPTTTTTSASRNFELLEHKSPFDFSIYSTHLDAGVVTDSLNAVPGFKTSAGMLFLNVAQVLRFLFSPPLQTANRDHKSS